MQALRTGIRSLSSSSARSTLSHCFNGKADFMAQRGSGLWLVVGARVFSQSAACAPASFLDKEEVTTRVVDLLKSIPFIDPSKVSPAATFKNDLQLDMLDNVEVVMAVEEEFAIDIPETEANKFSTTAHLIDYIAGHPQAK